MRAGVLILAVVMVGCLRPDPKPVVAPLESTLGAAVPAAHVAAMAFAALNGQPSPCATVSTPAGDGSVRVEVGLAATCPKMFDDATGGTLVVTGTWTPDLAIFAADFTRVEQSQRSHLVVEKIAYMTVVPRDQHLIIAYLQQDVEVASGLLDAAIAGQTAWVVDVDTAGTPDPSDDTISVSGGDQSLLAIGTRQPAAEATQVAVGNAVFHPGCRRNPNEGLAVVERAGSVGGGALLFSFHDACDGEADVSGAMSPYLPMIGESLPLVFLQ